MEHIAFDIVQARSKEVVPVWNIIFYMKVDGTIPVKAGRSLGENLEITLR